jgi:hypothetical protein
MPEQVRSSTPHRSEGRKIGASPGHPAVSMDAQEKYFTSRSRDHEGSRSLCDPVTLFHSVFARAIARLTPRQSPQQRILGAATTTRQSIPKAQIRVYPSPRKVIWTREKSGRIGKLDRAPVQRHR